MQNNKIIHITYELYPENLGGIGVFVFNLINEVSEIAPNRQFYVLLPVKQKDIENKFQNPNVKIVCIKDCYENNKLVLKLFLKKVSEYLNLPENKNSLIHFHDITLFHFFRNYQNTIYTFHKEDGITIPKGKKINSCIYFTKESQKKHFIPAKNKYIIPNGMYIEQKAAKIAYIGRTSTEKGFDKFVYYLNNSTLNNEYITIGDTTYSNAKVLSMGVLDNAQVSKELENIDYLFVPSTKEEFGLVILEALQHNTKVFVNDLKQLRQLFSKFKNVIFIDYSKTNFTNKIDKYIKKDFYQKQETLQEFSIKNVAKRYLEVYNGI